MDLRTFKNCVDIHPDVMDGKAVLKGTRFTVAQLIGELATGRTLAQVCNDFDLDPKVAKQSLAAVSASCAGTQNVWAEYLYFMALVAMVKDNHLKCECNTRFTDGELCTLCSGMYALSCMHGESFANGLRSENSESDVDG